MQSDEVQDAKYRFIIRQSACLNVLGALCYMSLMLRFWSIV